MSTVARELAKAYAPDQLKQLAELVKEEADKPRVDKRQLTRLQKDVKAAYVRQYQTEERLTALLSEAGKTNDEINEEINSLRREAEREAVSAPAAKAPGRRGRRKAQPDGAE
jgi:Glu-tRNA(Gln) amidotransferase subunit E-like FAD-binding protein